MRYGKIVDGAIVYHSKNNPIVNPDGSRTVTSDATLLLANGFLPVVFVTPPEPQDGYTLAASWTDDGQTITQTWTQTAVPADTNPTIEEQVIAQQETIDMLMACVLEMSEIIYA